MSTDAPEARRDDAPAPPTPPKRRGRLTRIAAYAASLAILAAAAFTVPLPYTEFVPGQPTAIPPLIELDGVETTEIDGETALLTVLLHQSTTITALGAMLDGDRTLRPTDSVVPDDVDREQFLEQERDRFRRQFDVAAAVGARAAGVDVELTTTAVLRQVLPDGPAAGALQAGDEVAAVGGEAITTAEQLQQEVRDRATGDEVTVQVRRGGREQEVEVTLGEVRGSSGPALGVMVETVPDRLELPFDVQLGDTSIGGPSAGMMIALTVYDMLADEDLIAGRLIHGTGSLDADGVVGPVGGVPEKMRASAAADADLVLVPDVLLQDALRTAPDDLDVVGVATFDEALQALRETRDEAGDGAAGDGGDAGDDADGTADDDEAGDGA